MNINLPGLVSGFYRVSVLGPDGDERKSTGWFKNLITDKGLNLMNGNGYLNTCVAGTDNTPPAVTDEALGALLGSTTSATRTDGRQTAAVPYYVYQIATFTFAQGDVVGNVAEIGVGANATTLFSRALVKDGLGNPTTITVLADEFLRVEYELRVQIPDVDTSGTFDIDATTYTWTGRALDIAGATSWTVSIADKGSPYAITASTVGSEVARAYSGDLVAITGSEPTGSLANRTSITVTPYTDGDFESSAAIVWGPNEANFPGGIGAVRFCSENGVSYQIGFSPNIPKTNTDQLTLNVTHSWGRA